MRIPSARKLGACVGLVMASMALTVSSEDALRLNQIQMVATHNSYHVAPPPALMKQLLEADPKLAEWDYTHAPLDVQLDRGVRGFELDVYYQPEGHFKVMHVPNFDTGTSCDTLVDCLTVIREWSRAHPDHVPVITHIEVKDEQYPQVPTKILEVNASEIDILDAEVHAVFDASQIFTPDDLRGDAESVNAAVLGKGWPDLDAVRGQCIFILHNRGRHRAEYLKHNPEAKGRALFNFAEPGAPDAAFLIRDNPNAEDVKTLAEAGYMLRTRAGGPENPGRLEAALASGAHLISSDFPPGEPDKATGFVVDFAGDEGYRLNPVTRDKE